jgi:flagellar biosynthesis GTPase FlhF
MDEYIVQLQKQHERSFLRMKTKNIREEIALENEKDDIICDDDTLDVQVNERVKQIKIPLMSTTDVGKLIIKGTRSAAIMQMNKKLKESAATFTRELKELEDSSRRIAIKLKELRDEEQKEATAKFIEAKRRGLETTVDFKRLQEEERAKSHRLVMQNKQETENIRKRALEKLEQSELKKQYLAINYSMYAIYEKTAMELSVVIKEIEENLARVRAGNMNYRNLYAGSVDYMGELHEYFSNTKSLEEAKALQKKCNDACKSMRKEVYDS